MADAESVAWVASQSQTLRTLLPQLHQLDAPFTTKFGCVRAQMVRIFSSRPREMSEASWEQLVEQLSSVALAWLSDPEPATASTAHIYAQTVLSACSANTAPAEVRAAFARVWTAQRVGSELVLLDPASPTRITLLLRALRPALDDAAFRERLRAVAESDASASLCASLDVGGSTTVLPSVECQASLAKLWTVYPSTCPDINKMRQRVACVWIPPLKPINADAAAAAAPSTEAAEARDKARQVLLTWIRSTVKPTGPAAAQTPRINVTLVHSSGAAAAATAATAAATTADATAVAAVPVTSSISLHRRSPLDKSGLDNLGNSCYLNSVLQSLFMTDVFRRDLLHLDRMRHFAFLRQHADLLRLQTIFGFMVASHRASYAPRVFYASLPDMFRDWTQQDAGEFAKYVLDVVGGGLKLYHRHLRQAVQTSNENHGSAMKIESAAEAGASSPTIRAAAPAAASAVPSAAASSTSISTPSAAATDAPRPVPVRNNCDAVPMELDSGMKGGNLLAATATSLPVVIVPNSTPPGEASSMPAAPSTVPALAASTIPLPPSPPATGTAASPIDMSADEYFGGHFLSTITCLTCATRSTKTEPFLELPLALEIDKVEAKMTTTTTATEGTNALKAPATEQPAAAATPAQTTSPATAGINNLISQFLGDAAPTALDSLAALAASTTAPSAPPVPAPASASTPAAASSTSPSAPTYTFPSGPLHLSSMLDHYFSPEILSGSDAYLCSRCSTKRTSTKQMRVVGPSPPHLLICLKRNKYEMAPTSSQGGALALVRNKILKEVLYPCVLKLPVTEREAETEAAEEHSASPSASSTPPPPPGRVVYRTYVLYSVIFHAGTSAQQGHYYAISRHSDSDALAQVASRVSAASAEERVREAASPEVPQEFETLAQAGPWHCLNDSSVSPSSYQQLARVTQNNPTHVAYLLFYRAVDTLQANDQDALHASDPTVGLPSHVLMPVESDNEAYAREQRAAAQMVTRALVLPKSTYTPLHQSQSNEPDNAIYDSDMS